MAVARVSKGGSPFKIMDLFTHQSQNVDLLHVNPKNVNLLRVNSKMWTFLRVNLKMWTFLRVNPEICNFLCINHEMHVDLFTRMYPKMSTFIYVISFKCGPFHA